MNFHTDIITELTSYFCTMDPNFKLETLISPNSNMTIQQNTRMQADVLLERLLVFQKMHLVPVRRRVFYSQEINDKLNSYHACFQPAVASIEGDLKNGVDINGRLSKLTDKLQTNDLMLYDWNLYHLHLGDTKDQHNNRYYKRTGELLIVYVPEQKTSAYLIDISEDHGQDKTVFAKQRYLEIIDNNWPDLLSPYLVKGAQLDGFIAESQRLDLRKAGKFCFDSVNGKMVAPIGGGINSAGKSVRIRKTADDIMSFIAAKEDCCRRMQKCFKPQQIPENLDFKLKLNSVDFSLSLIQYFPNLPEQIIEKFSLQL